jgi:hypothetical protein
MNISGFWIGFFKYRRFFSVRLPDHRNFKKDYRKYTRQGNKITFSNEAEYEIRYEVT